MAAGEVIWMLSYDPVLVEQIRRLMANRSFLKTVRGVGYLFTGPDDVRR